MSELKPFDEFMDALPNCDTVKVILTGVRESTFETKLIYEGICAFANRRAEPENKPMTLKELKHMNHQPIWAVGKRSLGTEVNGWMLIDTKSSRPAALDFAGACNFDNYGKTWLAYARKPASK